MKKDKSCDETGIIGQWNSEDNSREELSKAAVKLTNIQLAALLVEYAPDRLGYRTIEALCKEAANRLKKT